MPQTKLLRNTEERSPLPAAPLPQAHAPALPQAPGPVAAAVGGLLIQYYEPGSGKNQLRDAPAQIYVLQGTIVRFKVLSRPANLALNLLQAVWSNGTHSDNASYTFNNASAGTGTAQANTVTVSAGGQTAYVYVTVYQLNLRLEPVVVTQTANRTYFGVDERINLDFATVPAGITDVNIGGLRWSLTGVAGRKRKGVLQKSAVDKGIPGENGKAYYIAPYLTDDRSDTIQDTDTKTVTLQLTISGGPSNGQIKSIDITIRRPTGVLTLIPGSEWHIKDQPSAGFKAKLSFTPDDVSFSNLEFREASGKLTADGCFKGWASRADLGDVADPNVKTSHTPTIIGGDGVAIVRKHNQNIFLAGQDDGHDTVMTPYKPGTGASKHAGWNGNLLWAIYWQYRVRKEFRGSESDAWIRCQIADHHTTSDNNGHCVTTKAGARAEFDRTANDAPPPAAAPAPAAARGP